jgi:hypothetical protein
MFSPYGVMLVNPVKHPNVKKELGQQFRPSSRYIQITGAKG